MNDKKDRMVKKVKMKKIKWIVGHGLSYGSNGLGSCGAHVVPFVGDIFFELIYSLKPTYLLAYPRSIKFFLVKFNYTTPPFST